MKNCQVLEQVNMNDLHRVVLAKHSADLVKDVIPSETLLGVLYQRRIFDIEHIEIIRACKTPSEQIYKILELLPKRGPEAFPNFLEILQEQYDWLAKLLQDSLLKENEKLTSQQQDKQLVKREEDNALTPRATFSNISIDYDIKARTSAFVHRQFGQVRRISNTDKKAIERWLGEWLQNERKTLEKSLDDASAALKDIDVFQDPEIKEKIFTLYQYIITKLKKPAKMIAVKSNETNDESADSGNSMETMDREISAEDANFDLLQSEIDDLFTQCQNMKTQISRSFDYMGVKPGEKDLSFVVHDLCGEYRSLQSELVNERKKIESMLMELYEYSTNTNKLQHTITHQELEIIEMKEQINKLRQESIELIHEITDLEETRIRQEETVKMLEAKLEQTEKDFQALIQEVSQENKELKNMLQSGRSQVKQGVRGVQNRKPLKNQNVPRVANTSNSTNMNTSPRLSPRKPIPKKRSNSFR